MGLFLFIVSNVAKLLTTSVASTGIYDLSSTKSIVKDLRMRLVVSKFTMTMVDHMFMKMYPIILNRKVSQ